MWRIVTALLAGFGMTLLIGGILTVIGGHLDHEDHTLEYLGPLSGVWQASQARFFGAILASAGGGIFTFALMARCKN
jgi:hypothetical protein